MSCMHPPYPCRKARRSRKGGGSVAWWENGATQRNHRARSRQHKVCMVKARLLQSQSSRRNGERRRKVVDTTHRVDMAE
jgi:hypothetical protein